jgi:hypothetical protein
MPVILATQAEIRRLSVQSQPRKIVCETQSRKTLHKNRADGMAQGEDTEFKPQHRKKKRTPHISTMIDTLLFSISTPVAPAALQCLCLEEKDKV